jgi:hypothetical protein
MVLVTWRDGQNSKLQVVVVERRPCDFWKRRSKKRKLQKKTSSDVGTATSQTKSKEPSSAPVGIMKTEIQLLGDGNAKLLGVSSSESELEGLKADQIDYYVHYIDHDR